MKKNTTTTTFYAIHRGRQRGVFERWDDARLQVEGFSGAIYKKCPDMDSARRFVAVGYEKVIATMIDKHDPGKRTYVVASTRLPTNESFETLSSLSSSSSSSLSISKRARIDPQLPTKCFYVDGACIDNRIVYVVLDRDTNEIVFRDNAEESRDRAILKGIDRVLNEYRTCHLRIVCRSWYVYNAITRYRHRWRTNGWFLCTGEKVSYLDLMHRIDDALSTDLQRDVRWVHDRYASMDDRPFLVRVSCMVRQEGSIVVPSNTMVPVVASSQ